MNFKLTFVGVNEPELFLYLTGNNLGIKCSYSWKTNIKFLKNLKEMRSENSQELWRYLEVTTNILYRFQLILSLTLLVKRRATDSLKIG